MSPAKTARPAKMPFRKQNEVGPRNRVSDGCAHRRHLAIMIEPFVHGGDAALCQITLTT